MKIKFSNKLPDKEGYYFVKDEDGIFIFVQVWEMSGVLVTNDLDLYREDVPISYYKKYKWSIEPLELEE